MQRVHIELQRVQTWLFAVPRLRAMVGANTLLGEALRVGLPALARRQSGWKLAALRGAFPSADPDDPLRLDDDPREDARAGIAARDGGHFEVALEQGAEVFAEAAAALLRRELPDLRFRVSVDGLARSSGSSALSRELPVLTPCAWTGRGLASITVQQGDERAAVSLAVSQRHEAARRAEGNGLARDLASQIVGHTRLAELRRPATFSALAGSGYLALVHADGNAVGARAGATEDSRARFFHRARVLLRRALVEAIDVSCTPPPGDASDAELAPIVPLMLGGDDVLVACRAASALPFVVALCASLARLQAAEPADALLTLGVGVVIARPTIPVARLHAIAEHLTSSAKRRFRGAPADRKASVVDWAVHSASHLEEPEAARRRDWLRQVGDEQLVLSRRPLDVLGGNLSTLQGLLAGSAALEGAPRAQLRYLVDQLPLGRARAELAFAELSPAARSALRDSAGLARLWEQPSPESQSHLTSLLDLVEVFEIGRLGRKPVRIAEETFELPE
jgi:hypothetical protein